jgi:hypothetical protein
MNPDNIAVIEPNTDAYDLVREALEQGKSIRVCRDGGGNAIKIKIGQGIWSLPLPGGVV